MQEAHPPLTIMRVVCRWKQLGMAWELAALERGDGTGGAGSPSPAALRVSWPHERLRLKLADLPQLHRMLTQCAQQQQQQGVVPLGRCLFDYLGLVVGVGHVRSSGEWLRLLCCGWPAAWPRCGFCCWKTA